MKKILGVVAMLVLTASAAVAQVQAGFGALAGVVQDKTHAAIGGATVTLDNPGIGLHMVTKTNKAGEYKFSPLTVVGGYTVKVEAKGFATENIKDISTSVGTIITQNALLAVGQTDTVVEVEGAAVEQVQTDTSAVSQLVDAEVWKDSPLEDRSQNDFVGLTAGAAISSAGRGYAVNGARGGAGNFMVDGFDNNDQDLGGAGAGVGAGGAITTISPDAIEEFRVISSTPPAEYGRAGGFSTDTVLKSGTKHFHGSLFEYNRIQALAANDFFSNRNNQRDHLVLNEFGGSLGGPVYKDKTFFESTVEFHRLRQASPITGTGTTQAFLNFVQSGAFERFQEGTAQNVPTNHFVDSNGNTAIQEGTCPLNLGGTCPGLFSASATLGPVFTKLLASEPEALPLSTATFSPNTEAYVAQGLFTSYGGNFGNQDVLYPVPVYGPIAGAFVNSTNNERASTKLDHKFSEKDQFSATYLLDFTSATYVNGGGANTFGVPEENVSGSQNFGMSYTHTFSPTLVNVAKASYLRHVSNFSSPGTSGVFEEATADSLSEGFGANSGLPQYFTDQEFAYEDAITKTYKINTFKSGFRFLRTRNASQFYNDVNGTLFPWSVEGLATDAHFDETQDDYFFGGPTYGGLYYASASVDPSGGRGNYTLPNVYRGYRANEFSAYVQDDVKFSSRLTVNVGIRWEYFGPPHNFLPGIDSNVYFGSATTATQNGNPFLPLNNKLIAGEQGATFQLAQANGRSTIWKRDTNNFAPRLGFAYDTMGNGKFVIRGGFGIGYDRLYNNVFENIRFNSPHFADNTVGYGAGSAVPASIVTFNGIYSDPFSATNGNYALAGSGGKPVPRHIDQNLVTAYYEQAHLGFETALPKGFILETNYIGTWGRKLVGLSDANNFDGRTACYSGSSTAQRRLCTAAGYTTFTTARPNAIFNGDNFRSNHYNSNYNSAQVSLRKSYSYGLQMLANYTYSKALDETSDVFTQRSGITGITDPTNPAYDYAPADFNQKHVLIITANYEYKPSKKNLLTAGWAISPILKMSSGLPFTPFDSQSTYDPNKDGRTGIDRIVYTGGGSIKNAIIHGGSPAGDNNGHGGYLNLAKFSPVLAGTATACPVTSNSGLFCDPAAGRNTLTAPSDYNLDIAATKRFYIVDKQTVTFQANFYNAFNHPNFGSPVHDFNATSNVDTSSTAGAHIGQSTSDAGPRVIQLALRYEF
jgi:hypothetical protein